MRRIPRTSRSIDPSIPSQLVLRPRVSLSPRCAALTCSPLFSTTSASFSTSSTRYSSEGSEGRKQHVAFVRKWQKRLLGDSEPIGSHVDPYDGSSPIRIAPEETGEEIEMLEELAGMEGDREHGEGSTQSLYREAETGVGLMRVGGERWVKEQKEQQLLERFNMLLAHSGEGYGAVAPKFGSAVKARTTKSLNTLFHRAVVEILTLKAARVSPVVTKGNRDGSQITEGWTEKVQLQWSPETGVQLKNPDPSTTVEFLKSIYVPRARAQQMDQAIRRAKQQSQPTQKTKGTGAQASKTSPEIEAATQTLNDAQSALQTVEAAFANVQNEVSSLRYKFLLSATRSSQKTVTRLTRELRDLIALRSSSSITLLKPYLEGPSAYRHISLTSPHLKFAFQKRLLELTGHHIPDPTLYSADTLSDLHKSLFTIAQPAPKKVYGNLLTELAPRPRVRVQRSALSRRPTAERVPSKLSRMQNVTISGRRIREADRDAKTGIRKVIRFALQERGLPVRERGGGRRRRVVVV